VCGESRKHGSERGSWKSVVARRQLAGYLLYCNRPFLTEVDREALEANGGTWHTGSWKGRGSANYRISRDAVDMMNDEITDNINEMVGENDTLWHLGDFAFASKNSYYHKCQFYRGRIKCKDVRYVCGNHDNICDLTDELAKPEHKRCNHHHNYCIRGLFSRAYSQKEINVYGQKICLNHYAGAIWDKSHRGAWHLYGHSHSQAEPWLNKNMPGRRSMDVGVDNAYKLLGKYRPFSFEEIQEIMKDRSGFSMDHHVPKDSKAPSEEELNNCS